MLTKLISTFFALILMVAYPVANANAAAQDARPLTEAEMGNLYGGFTLPNGVDVNIGITNQLSINGILVASAQFSLNGTTVTTSATGASQINGASGGLTNLLQFAAAGSTIITNTANNLTLDQVRTVNVSITNMSPQALQALNSLSLVQAQAMAGLRNGIH